MKDIKSCRIEKAVIFPLNDPYDQSFSKPNDFVYNAYKSHKRKLIPFFRLNPKRKWKEEFEKRASQGFMGIKLHPRSQHFDIASDEAMKVYAKAEKHDLPVLIHTGHGLNEISVELEMVVKDFPRLRLILGHSAFIDMDRVIRKMSKSRYVYFETSATSVFDLYNLIDKADKTSIVYGSDVPYVSCDYSLESIIHVASILNISMRDLGNILSGNLQKWFE